MTTHPAGALGILAGGGALPLRVARTALAAGRPVFAIALQDWSDPAEWCGVPHITCAPGSVGRIFAAFRDAGVREVVMAGTVRRPSIRSLSLDAEGARVLSRLGRAFFLGDDGLLRALARVLEEEGFAVVAPQQVLEGLLPPAGLLTRVAPPPSRTARTDIARGIEVARALGAVDVGQAVVVQDGLVLGVEAIEGTDALLARCVELTRAGAEGGVLVKLRKPGQDHRLDLPAIGPGTVNGAAAAALAGVAFEAGATILIDRDRTIAAAEAARLFLLAVVPDQFDPVKEISA